VSELLSPSRILIADDDPAVLQAISWVLKEHGYEVDTAQESSAVIDCFEAQPPDLLLLDVLLPDVDGYQLLERIKTDDRWRAVPVLMLSSVAPEDASVRTLSLGAADYIRKPFRVKELLARIQAHLRSRMEARITAERLRAAEEELVRAREEAENRRKLVDILHEVTGDLAPDEIYQILARRVARALGLTHCSVVLAQAGDHFGIVATSHEDPTLRNFRIDLERYPEIRTALDHGRAVLVEDVATSPLYESVREVWRREQITVAIRSVVALPFTLGRLQSGVFFLRRTGTEPPLTTDDVEFADAVIKGAVAAIQRAQIIETTRADNARLEALAHTDPLTQVLNRRALTERLESELERARRYLSLVTLLLVDLDHFKNVNDTHGHLVGDEVLRDVAALLRSAVRSVDVVARYGGEEFVVVLPETARPGAVTFAERLRERIEAHNFPELTGLGLHLTASIGVATYPSPEVESVEDLLAKADEALYRAKAAGRNLVHT
jgi:two-component system, cell cycle response regulator